MQSTVLWTKVKNKNEKQKKKALKPAKNALVKTIDLTGASSNTLLTTIELLP
jgi:hypothetical protein